MSKVLPNTLVDRPELNLRQGIKSSLNHWRALLASLHLLYLYVADGGSGVYCKEVKTGGKTVLDIDDQFANWLDKHCANIPIAKTSIRQCPLFQAQMEHLQVGLELFLKLAKIDFVDSTLADASERTGGSRFRKRVAFATNMKAFADTISAYPEPDRAEFIKKWLGGEDDAVISPKVKEVLVPFAEECQFKIRTSDGEVCFQQDGVYDGLREQENTVESADIREPVGPFRVLKSYVREGMHPYLSDSTEGFEIKGNVDAFQKYADMVKTALSLNPKRTTVYQEVPSEIAEIEKIKVGPIEARQLITYGAPGTGKSHRVDALTNETNSIRVTFHPDTDYSMFVGSYKPTMAAQERYALDATGKTHKIDAKEKAISYSFVPQAFLKAYVEAWRRWCDAALPDEEKRLYLVIEEINRGNCAQIFGDMFQLLDRCESGWSCYAVAPDDDIQRFLGEDAKYGLGGLAWADSVVNDDGKVIATAEQIKTGARMVLPPNLCILATMNTSDQSLFPIDSAFKRRWDWEYVPITEGRAKDGEPLGWKIRPVEKTEDIVEGTPEYDWWDFVRGVNARIGAATRSEDKKIGYFFVKPEAADGKRIVTSKKILSKVIFYLWNDVFKDLGFARIFSRNGKGVEFNEFYGEDGKMNIDLVREFVETMVGKADATPTQQG